ncbi:hypothetical protein [Clostridium cylindrosporum]|uniref:Uncharacterized protein n=1 Tax=Clostridium cylindrosporum DSM 605 TaxID=1121307 RepID=A0A0J8D9M0_CLOCY|nr:hypothetical protein [Clostridium cylindrosporum]KMT22750.1 hypothetical protein CLCY_11c00840 [Clostridium cylindrosporum DSM 605]
MSCCNSNFGHGYPVPSPYVSPAQYDRGYGNCGFGGIWIIIIILLLCCDGFNGIGGRHDGCDDGFSGIWIIIIILLLCGCGSGFGY